MARNKLYIWIYGVFLPVVLQDVMSTSDILENSQVIPQSAKTIHRIPEQEKSTSHFTINQNTTYPLDTSLPSTLPMEGHETILSSLSSTEGHHTPDMEEHETTLSSVSSTEGHHTPDMEEHETTLSSLSSTEGSPHTPDMDESETTLSSVSQTSTEGHHTPDMDEHEATLSSVSQTSTGGSDDAYLYHMTTKHSVSKQPTSTTTEAASESVRFPGNPEAVHAKTTTPTEFSNTNIAKALFKKHVVPSAVSLRATTVARETGVPEESERGASHPDGYLSNNVACPEDPIHSPEHPKDPIHSPEHPKDPIHSPEHSVSPLQGNKTENSSKYTNPSNADDSRDPVPNLHQKRDPVPLHVVLPPRDLELTPTVENGRLADTGAKDRPGVGVLSPVTTSINSSDEQSAEQLLGNLNSLTREEIRTVIDRHLGPVLISAKKDSLDKLLQEERNIDKAHEQSLETGNDKKDTEAGVDDAVAAARCYTGKMDLAILVDASDDFRKRDMIRLQKFIIKLLRPFKFGEENLQLSMVTSNKQSHVMFDFEQFDHDLDMGGRPAVESRIRKTLKPGLRGNAGSVLRMANNKLFGECGDRSTVPNIVLLITGGALLEDDLEQTLQEAMTLKQNGVHLLGLVIGQCNEDFKSVVSNSEDAICVKKSELLPSFIEELQDKICKEVED